MKRITLIPFVCFSMACKVHQAEQPMRPWQALVSLLATSSLLGGTEGEVPTFSPISNASIAPPPSIPSAYIKGFTDLIGSSLFVLNDSTGRTVFTGIAPSQQLKLVVLNQDGELNSSFLLGNVSLPDVSTASLEIPGERKIILAGHSNAGSFPAAILSCVETEHWGTVWSKNFTTPPIHTSSTGSGGRLYVRDLALLPDGKVLLAILQVARESDRHWSALLNYLVKMDAVSGQINWIRAISPYPPSLTRRRLMLAYPALLTSISPISASLSLMTGIQAYVPNDFFKIFDAVVNNTNGDIISSNAYGDSSWELVGNTLVVLNTTQDGNFTYVILGKEIPPGSNFIQSRCFIATVKHEEIVTWLSFKLQNEGCEAEFATLGEDRKIYFVADSVSGGNLLAESPAHNRTSILWGGYDPEKNELFGLRRLLMKQYYDVKYLHHNVLQDPSGSICILGVNRGSLFEGDESKPLRTVLTKQPARPDQEGKCLKHIEYIEREINITNHLPDFSSNRTAMYQNFSTLLVSNFSTQLLPINQTMSDICNHYALDCAPQ